MTLLSRSGGLNVLQNSANYTHQDLVPAILEEVLILFLFVSVQGLLETLKVFLHESLLQLPFTMEV